MTSILSAVPEEMEFKLEGFTLRGQRWGRGSPIKVLALHGWLDNSASFGLLAPALKDCDVLALDLAGHGRSGWRESFSAYNIWQDLSELQQVLSLLNWTQCALLGHSRGAMISTLFAGSFPEQVKGLCLIDALGPMTLDAAMLPQQLATSVNDLLLMKTRDIAYYRDFQSTVNARMRGFYPLSQDASARLAARSVSENEHGFFWAHDPLLKVSSEIRLTETQVQAFFNRFSQKAKVIMATEGFMAKERQHPWFLHPNISVSWHEGRHHLHLDAEPYMIDQLAEQINDYFCNVAKASNEY